MKREKEFNSIALGVNIDHVATLRNARGGDHPDPIRAARIALEAKADNITVHLREDRRHIRETDIERLKAEIPLPLNLEIAATQEMVDNAIRYRPEFCCLVPERREEVTTEGGLNLVHNRDTLETAIKRLTDAGIHPSLFIDPEPEYLERARALGAAAVELHTGPYCRASSTERPRFLNALRSAADRASSLGLECHAGHGLTFETVEPIAALKSISTLNIGHFLIGEAVFTGLLEALSRMRRIIDRVR